MHFPGPSDELLVHRAGSKGCCQPRGYMAQDSSQEDVFTFEMSLVKEASGSGLFASKLPGGRSLGGIYFVWQLELALSSGGRGFGLGCDGAWGRCTRGDAAEGLGTLIASEDATNTSRRDKDLAENSLMPMTMLQIDSKASPSTIEEGLLFQGEVKGAMSLWMSQFSTHSSPELHR